MTNFNHSNRRKAAYRKGFDAGLIVSPFPAVRALRSIAAMQDHDDADIDDILLIANTALKMQAEQGTINIDYVARSIVRAACELDTTPDPESDDTITIAVQDLETIAHRHITASVETFELLAPEPTTPAAAPSVAGWKLVPIEPSAEMIAAAKSTTSAALTRSHATEIYHAMLAAAPAKHEAGE